MSISNTNLCHCVCTAPSSWTAAAAWKHLNCCRLPLRDPRCPPAQQSPDHLQTIPSIICSASKTWHSVWEKSEQTNHFSPWDSLSGKNEWTFLERMYGLGRNSYWEVASVSVWLLLLWKWIVVVEQDPLAFVYNEWMYNLSLQHLMQYWLSHDELIKNSLSFLQFFQSRKKLVKTIHYYL